MLTPTPDAAPCRYLFLVRNRRGLGHMMRALNIAQALRRLDPQADIHIHVRAAPAEGFWPANIGLTVDDPDRPETGWPATLARLAPDVLVHDTMLPADEPVLPTGTRLAFVMRKCLSDEQAALYAHPWMPHIARIVVPHRPEELDPPPAHVAERCTWVGPIVRTASTAAQQRLRRLLQLAPEDLLLTTTVGGGGFEAQADRFFEVALAVHQRLRASGLTFRHVLVKGPNYGKRLPDAPGLTVLDSDPDLVSLLALSDLVIAEGGYNTVHEVLGTATPALFLPSARGKDDQVERVQALAAAGCAEVFDPLGLAVEAHVAVRAEALLRDPARRAAMRERARERAPQTGNLAAAAVLRDLARTARTDRGDVPPRASRALDSAVIASEAVRRRHGRVDRLIRCSEPASGAQVFAVGLDADAAGDSVDLYAKVYLERVAHSVLQQTSPPRAGGGRTRRV